MNNNNLSTNFINEELANIEIINKNVLLLFHNQINY